jgi:hypothetical protein
MDLAEEDSILLWFGSGEGGNKDVSSMKVELLSWSIVTAERAGSTSGGTVTENTFGAGLLAASIIILNCISSRWYGHGPVMGLQVQLSGDGNMKRFGSGWNATEADKLSSIGSSDVTGNGWEGALIGVVSMELDNPSIDAVEAMSRFGTEL